MTDPKRAMQAARRAMDLHVGLIMYQDKLAIADARARAYTEGAAGLARRTATP